MKNLPKPSDLKKMCVCIYIYTLANIYLIYFFCQTPENSGDFWLFAAERIV